MIRRVAAADARVRSLRGPDHEIVEDRFDIAETSGSPEVSEVVDVGGGDVALSGNLGDAGPRRCRGHRRDALDPRALVRPAAGGAGRRASGGGARADARRRHRRARSPGDAVRIAAGRRQQRGRPRRAADRRAALRGGAGAGRGRDRLGRGRRRTARSPPGRRRRAARAGSRCRPTGAPPISRTPARSIVSVVEMPAPGGPKVVYRLDLGDEPILALAAAGRAPVLAVVRENDVLLLDTSSPLRPARSAPRALPPEIRRAHVVAADLSPDGKLLAVATADGQPGRAARSRCRAAAPPWPASWRSSRTSARACWSTSRSRRRATRCGCCRATRRAAARAGRSRPSCARCVWARARRRLTNLEVARVGDGRQPPAIRRASRVGRAPPLVSGAAIRLPPERATVFFAAAAKPPRRARTSRPRAGGDRSRRGGGVPRRRRGRGDRRHRGGGPARHAGSVVRRPLAAGARAGDGRTGSRAVGGRRGRPAPAPAPVDVVRAGPGRGAARRAARSPQLRIQP